MKNLYLSFLSILFGVMFWLSFVTWDIINPSLNIIKETTYLEYPYWVDGDNLEYFKTHEFYSIISGIEQRIWYFANFLWLCFVLSIAFLCLIFKKMWEKWWKALVPFYNFYILLKFVWIKKVHFWLVWVNMLIIIIFWFTSVFTNCHNCTYSAGEYINDDWIFLLHHYFYFSWSKLLSVMFGCLAWLYVSILMFIVYCRLFRKFGWNIWYPVLWALFFPLWACALWFGNFERQWEILDKKDVDN